MLEPLDIVGVVEPVVQVLQQMEEMHREGLIGQVEVVEPISEEMVDMEGLGLTAERIQEPMEIQLVAVAEEAAITDGLRTPRMVELVPTEPLKFHTTRVRLSPLVLVS
jgi:hypothetical protein